jgi:hypothetical protein
MRKERATAQQNKYSLSFNSMWEIRIKAVFDHIGYVYHKNDSQKLVKRTGLIFFLVLPSSKSRTEVMCTYIPLTGPQLDVVTVL